MNINARQDDVFLATTALEEFWDITKPVVFLGHWCLLHSKSPLWQTLDGKILDSPFKNREDVVTASKYINELQERVLKLLADALNDIHGVAHSNRYWRIILGPWLQLYLPVTYDRYININHAKNACPNFSTLGLSEKSFVIPFDTEDFSNYIKDDIFNLQIYTQILCAMGYNFPTKVAKISSIPQHKKTSNILLRHVVADKISKMIARFSVNIYKSILLRSSYFSKSVELKLAIKNIGKILPVLGQSRQVTESIFDKTMREKLKNIELGVNGYEKCLSIMLFSDIPTCFVEGYKSTESAAKNEYPKVIKGIFSANAWYYDEIFKHWSADSAEKGAILLGTQHGGNYGALANMPSENHEKNIVDFYYSWGWTQDGCFSTIIPMPASKLLGRGKIEADNRKKEILWVATTTPRYLIEFSFLPIDFKEYLLWQERFVKALHHAVITTVRLRPHREDNGWDVIQRLHERSPNLKIETWDIPFQESLANCRLYVCDHFSTTFAEALSANKPTILFWNPLANELRSEAQPYYDLLRKNGILFDTPESAATAVNQIYDDIETWWNDPERQSAVNIFCNRFARTSSHGDELWASEFKRIAALPSSLGH